MAVIGVTINEVLRDFIGQLEFVHAKYYEDVEITEDTVKDNDYLSMLSFKDKKEFNTFLYVDSSVEVLALATQRFDNSIAHLNNFIEEVEDEEEHKVLLISKEVQNSVPATLYFLSKTGFKGSDIKFVKNYDEVWDYTDVMITASDEVIKSKPTGKKVIKVDCLYNKGIEADMVIETPSDIFNNYEKINELI
jgi:hypothetical protein